MSPGPMDGLLVVDLTRVLAGPLSTLMLADLGARVIKVERPGHGDDSRSYGPFMDGRSLYFARVNRGKQSIALDLKDPDDHATLLSIIDRADVLVENFRPGVMDRLGLDWDTLSQRNPRLVYVSISGFGRTGPWRNRPAYDAVVQAATGIMSITGSPDSDPVKPGVPIADLAAGLYAFGAIGAALYGRLSTGRGTHIDIGMFDATLSLLEGAALSYLATGDTPPRIGNAHYSIAPFDTFACADRSIVICAANDSLFAGLCRALDRPDLGADPRFVTNSARLAARDAFKQEAERTLRARPAAYWLKALGTAGIPCGLINNVAEAVSSEQAVFRDMVVDAGGLPLPGNPVKMADWPQTSQRPPEPRLDADGPAIRAEFG
ncbi:MULTISPECIES: CaiB/BaiF CoA transferase family protein [Protofrankia]|uniref:Formyl-CoA transferase n=1 Tax=Candidatus Protofrankia datiscae TaxID=2716812 RepID=F8B368_9ACTN|nr:MULTISPECIES: CoA transferase [Protofrankia]AEH10868.1 Formyl-CoA transferase [Candidatus Protofrankia datiscae]